MKRLHIGCIVICIKCEEFPEVIGHVGEIIGIHQTSWECKFPGLPEIRCSDCGRLHKVGSWDMNSDEIKPLEDPDLEAKLIEEIEYSA